MVRVAGVEPTTCGFGGRHSIQLSYTRGHLVIKMTRRKPYARPAAARKQNRAAGKGSSLAKLGAGVGARSTAPIIKISNSEIAQLRFSVAPKGQTQHEPSNALGRLHYFLNHCSEKNQCGDWPARLRVN